MTYDEAMKRAESALLYAEENFNYESGTRASQTAFAYLAYAKELRETAETER